MGQQMGLWLLYHPMNLPSASQILGTSLGLPSRRKHQFLLCDSQTIKVGKRENWCMFQSVFLGFRSHMWISAFVLSHFTLFFSFLTSLHTSISSIRCKINGLTEAIITNFHNCVWSNPFNKLCVCTSMFTHMHTCATSGWFQFTWYSIW